MNKVEYEARKPGFTPAESKFNRHARRKIATLHRLGKKEAAFNQARRERQLVERVTRANLKVAKNWDFAVQVPDEV